MLKPPKHHKLGFSKWEMPGFLCIKFDGRLSVGLFFVVWVIFFCFGLFEGFFRGRGVEKNKIPVVTCPLCCWLG